MTQLTRIGYGSLYSEPGSVVLPQSITLLCPQCGTPVADKGQCIASFEVVPNDHSKTGLSLKVFVDCRNCGAFQKEPDVKI